MKSLSSKLTLWYAVAVTLTVAVFLVFGRYLLEESYIDGIGLLNDSEFEEIRPRLLDIESNGNVDEVVEAVFEHTEIDAALFFFQIGRSDDEPIFRSGNMGNHYFPKSVHGQREITVEVEHLGLLRVSEYRINGYDVHIASSLEGLNSLNRSLLRTAVWILGAIFLTSLIVGCFLGRVALNPIASIQRTADRISANNLGERIPVSEADDEVANLAKLLNAMFDRLQASFLQVQQFTADASHELKTPLSLVRLNAEELQRDTKEGETNRAKLIENQIEEIDRLNQVINDLLILAKADAGALKLKLEPHDLCAYLKEFGEDARMLCEDKALRFEYEVDCSATVRLDPVWLRNVFFNLLSNSIKFAPKGSSIRLIVKRGEEKVFVTVEDFGPGVDEADLPKIFNRFYRKSVEKGSGLGLALCKSIVTQHGGTISARNRSGGTGLIVEMSFDVLERSD